MALAGLQQSDDVVGGLARRANDPFFQDGDAVENGILTTGTRQDPVDGRPRHVFDHRGAERSPAEWATQLAQ